MLIISCSKLYLLVTLIHEYTRLLPSTLHVHTDSVIWAYQLIIIHVRAYKCMYIVHHMLATYNVSSYTSIIHARICTMSYIYNTYMLVQGSHLVYTI